MAVTQAQIQQLQRTITNQVALFGQTANSVFQRISPIKINSLSPVFPFFNDMSGYQDSGNKGIGGDETQTLGEGIEYKPGVVHQISYEQTIPLKDEMKSNLNVFFGKGRENKNTRRIVPREWYEVELIVSHRITERENYPEKKKPFTVYTDDGYKFKCKVNGNNSKNFRSEGDLKILGRWIKGRLENRGALQIGERVTKETFSKYGRDSITLTKLQTADEWFLDFGVK